VATGDDAGALLCVVHFPANTGFAWDFIEGIYARLAIRAERRGVATYVAYPRIDAPPRTLAGSPARAVVLQVAARTPAALARLLAFVRRHRVRTVYLTDRPTRDWSYILMRLAGVRRIVVHDHTSGERTAATGLRRLLKRLHRAIPGIEADRVLAVSDFVAARQVDVTLTPPAKVRRVWNGIPVPEAVPDRHEARRRLGLPLDRPIIACCCRATPEKGVDRLISAMARLAIRHGDGRKPLLVYAGDGPALASLRVQVEQEGLGDVCLLVGYSRDVRGYLAAADVVAVPSVWQDALPLSVLEAMSLGRPLVATRVGGIPEMCRDGVDGLLVPPGDDAALAEALARLLGDAELRARLGTEGRNRVRGVFAPETQLDAIAAELGLAAAEP
jgi:glycosyltransferase involved in cell wall biosynthesis